MSTSITIPESAWTDTTTSRTRDSLLATVIINGCSVHVMAEAVETDADGCQVGVGESDYAEYAIGLDSDVALETLTIAGREYVLFAIAHGA